MNAPKSKIFLPALLLVLAALSPLGADAKSWAVCYGPFKGALVDEKTNIGGVPADPQSGPLAACPDDPIRKGMPASCNPLDAQAEYVDVFVKKAKSREMSIDQAQMSAELGFAEIRRAAYLRAKDNFKNASPRLRAMTEFQLVEAGEVAKAKYIRQHSDWAHFIPVFRKYLPDYRKDLNDEELKAYLSAGPIASALTELDAAFQRAGLKLLQAMTESDVAFLTAEMPKFNEEFCQDLRKQTQSLSPRQKASYEPVRETGRAVIQSGA